VYDTDLVRQLCREIAEEQDPKKTGELVSLLHAMIKDDQDEVRTRLSFLAQRYANLIDESRYDSKDESKAAD
jgi:hypothetical protein